MGFHFQDVQESSIRFGDFHPEFSQNLKKEIFAATEIIQDYSITPLSPQLQILFKIALTRNPSSARISRPASRIFSPPKAPAPPSCLRSSTNLKFVRVPYGLCYDNKVAGYKFCYFSRDTFLKKMFVRLEICRTHLPWKLQNKTPQELIKLGLLVNGLMVDYYIIFPLKLPTMSKQPLRLPFLYVGQNPNQPTANAWVYGPVNIHGNQVHKLQSSQPRPALLMKYYWVSNPSCTQFLSLKEILKSRNSNIFGHFECPKCKDILQITYILPARVNIVSKHVLEKKHDIEVNGGKFLWNTDFFCECDGERNPLLPFISDNLNMINWLFLYLSYGLVHCTLAQLQYFCNVRRLKTSGGKKSLVLCIFLDICKQLNPEVLIVNDT